MKSFQLNPIRVLANSNYWQTLYQRCKEIGSLQLFVNNRDLSKFQIIFLQWLEVYNSLHIDLSTNQGHLNEEILKDEIRVDAYLYYRRKRRENKLFDEQEQKKQKTDNKTGLPSVKFTRSKK
ncbi:hypothetical protein LCGC14_1181040 [marine sediment metagenome]|uniref:Uncharacterized protein n=1 Tax=marine sediment metagenome TaxID=412755 RepID=A0A0F9LM70_9ZZZZ